LIAPSSSIASSGSLLRPVFSPPDASPWGLILASVVAFSLMQLVFRNPLALALTFAGGLLGRCHLTEEPSPFFEHSLSSRRRGTRVSFVTLREQTAV
jgi:hypothetical protein